MALIVEDGSGKSDSESYVSVADVDTYFGAGKYNNAAWTGSATVKEVALRKATQYLDATYRPCWRGSKKLSTQALAWPRTNVEDSDGRLLSSDALPQSLKDACCELALKALTETLLPDLTNSGSIKAKSVKVSSVEQHIEYAGGNSPRKLFSLVDGLLGDLTYPAGRIIRA